MASFGEAPDPRVRTLLSDLVRHLHTFVATNDVTEDEWQYAIDFLTRTGEICGPTRQEFVLLSDTLGVSSAVDLLTNSRTPSATPSAVLGPFYVDGPPETEHGGDIAAGCPASRSGRTCGSRTPTVSRSRVRWWTCGSPTRTASTTSNSRIWKGRC